MKTSGYSYRKLPAVFVMLLCALNLSALDESGLIAHFTFDDDTAAELKSTDGNYVFKPREGGKADFSHVEFVEGVYGKALHLKKGNTVHYCLPPGVLTDLKPPFTIALWIKRTEDKTEHKHAVFCGTCAEPKEFGFELSWFWYCLTLRWGDGGKSYAVTTPARTLFVDKWHHAAAVHDGKTVTLYVDGMALTARKADAEFVHVPKDKKFANRFTLGQFPTSFNAYPHVGLMDDLFLFSRTLSREEIVALAEGTLSR